MQLVHACIGHSTDNFAPKNAVDNFERCGTKPIGSDERNIRFLTPGRCRHTGDGQTLDADCTYKNTGPQIGRILLEFDDPSRAPCDASMTYSSQTAGSFLDKCFSAGINVQFDMGFSMWRERSTPETVQRAPGNQDEFDELVFGRDDLIPGLCFGNCISGVAPERGIARRIGPQSSGRDGTAEFFGSYTYENTGPSQGVLTFMQRTGGKTWVFTLDFDRSGTISVNTTDPNGNSTTWPGFVDLDMSLGTAQPVLLPVPPSWLASGSDRLEVPEDQQLTLGEELAEAYLGDPDEWTHLFESYIYDPLGRNRGILTIEFQKDLPWVSYSGEDSYRTKIESLIGSTLVFEMNFVSDEVAEFTLTIMKDGHPPRVEKGVFDVVDGEIDLDLDDFPEELFLPDEDPQAAGADMSGTEVAAAVTPGQITGDDVQPFLVSSTADYEPGDWLEPKDGGDQRMMVVGGSGSPASAKLLPEHDSPLLKSQFTAFPQASPITALPRAKRVSQAFSSTLTQLYVVCMQIDRDIPRRGARYFSRPKTAQTPVERCQRDCVLNESRSIQHCVWECEEDAQ